MTPRPEDRTPQDAVFALMEVVPRWREARVVDWLRAHPGLWWSVWPSYIGMGPILVGLAYHHLTLTDLNIYLPRAAADRVLEEARVAWGVTSWNLLGPEPTAAYLGAALQHPNSALLFLTWRERP